MIFENEITVEVPMNINQLHSLLTKNGFVLKEEYKVNDIYYSNKDINNVENYLDILKDCILIREIIENTGSTKMITYKHKEFDEDGNIINQGKVKCNIDNIDSACNLFTCLKYNQIIEIKDNLKVYANNDDEIVIQEANDKHIYIEIEENCNYIAKKYSSLEEMKNIFKKYNIPIINNNYFVKKSRG